MGVNILEDARHSSVFYVCKYFVGCLVQSTYLKKFKEARNRFEGIDSASLGSLAGGASNGVVVYRSARVGIDFWVP